MAGKREFHESEAKHYSILLEYDGNNERSKAIYLDPSLEEPYVERLCYRSCYEDHDAGIPFVSIGLHTRFHGYIVDWEPVDIPRQELRAGGKFAYKIGTVLHFDGNTVTVRDDSKWLFNKIHLETDNTPKVGDLLLLKHDGFRKYSFVNNITVARAKYLEKHQ